MQLAFSTVNCNIIIVQSIVKSVIRDLSFQVTLVSCTTQTRIDFFDSIIKKGMVKTHRKFRQCDTIIFFLILFFYISDLNFANIFISQENHNPMHKEAYCDYDTYRFEKELKFIDLIWVVEL